MITVIGIVIATVTEMSAANANRTMLIFVLKARNNNDQKDCQIVGNWLLNASAKCALLVLVTE